MASYIFVYLPSRNLDNVSLMQCCATENWLMFDTSLSFVGNSGHHIWVRRSCCKSSTTHLYQYVQYFYMCPNNGMVASIWNFNMCTDVDACNCTWGVGGGGTVGTPQESLQWELILGEKSIATLGTQTNVRIVPGFLVRCSTNWVILAPLLFFLFFFDVHYVCSILSVQFN